MGRNLVLRGNNRNRPDPARKESREANSRPQKDVASYVHGGNPNAGVWPNQAPISQISSDRLGKPSRLETSTVVPAVAVAAP